MKLTVEIREVPEISRYLVLVLAESGRTYHSIEANETAAVDFAAECIAHEGALTIFKQS